MNERRIRTLIVDDSALVRKLLTDSLSHEPGIEVVGTAIDPYVARDKILSLKPDVLTLDIEMPRMDGLTFLKLLMKHHPMPVIIISSLTSEGSSKALEALQAGAVDVLAKPSGSYSAYEDGAKLAEKIKAAAQAKLKGRELPPAVETGFTPEVKPVVEARVVPAKAPAMPGRTQPTQIAPTPTSAKISTLRQPPVKILPANGRFYQPRQIILMGASTGGTEALKEILVNLSPDLPGICIVQHIPAYFSLAFANRLNELCRVEVREAKAGDILKPGLALVAPGGHHVVLRWQVNHYVVELNDGPAVHHQRPAVDVMFDSAVKTGAAQHAMGVLLTGMGADGAAGLLRLRQNGALTVAQNEETCVVFGMPKEAIRLGAAQQVLPLGQIAARVERHATEVAINHRAAVH